MGLVLLVLLPRKILKKSQASLLYTLPVGCCSLLSLMKRKEFPLLSHPPLYAMYYYLECPERGPLYIHQDFSCTGERRRGWRSPDTVTEVPNKRAKLLLICIYYYCYLCTVLGRSPNEASEWTLKLHSSTSSWQT